MSDRYEQITEALLNMGEEKLRFIIQALMLAGHVEYLPVEKAIDLADTIKESGR